MCKIAVVAGVRDARRLVQFRDAMLKPMTEHDNHGFGYAIGDGERVSYEKWTEVKEALKVRRAYSKLQETLSAQYGGVLDSERTYEGGGPEMTPTAMLLHSRYATNPRVIENTHPFIDDMQTTALVHNGVISNPNQWLVNSTCDSEALLTRYIQAGVMDEPSKLGEALGVLNGYYAFGVISMTSEGRQIVDIVRDDRAPLNLCRVKELGDVFCTSAALVRAACNKLKWRLLTTIPVKDFSHIRLDAVTGKVLHAGGFKVERKHESYVPSGVFGRDFSRYSCRKNL